MKNQQKRERPIEDRDRVLDSLDEIELQAKKRISSGDISSLGKKLNLEWGHKDPNFRYYWFIDGEHQQSPRDALFAGWEFERFEHGSEHGGEKGEKVVKSKHGEKNYLMKIPKELYKVKEDEYYRRVNEKDRDLNKLSDREYAGESKELGKGKAVVQTFVDNPDVNPLME